MLRLCDFVYIKHMCHNGSHISSRVVHTAEMWVTRLELCHNSDRARRFKLVFPLILSEFFALSDMAHSDLLVKDIIAHNLSTFRWNILNSICVSNLDSILAIMWLYNSASDSPGCIRSYMIWAELFCLCGVSDCNEKKKKNLNSKQLLFRKMRFLRLNSYLRCAKIFQKSSRPKTHVHCCFNSINKIP